MGSALFAQSSSNRISCRFSDDEWYDFNQSLLTCNVKYQAIRDNNFAVQLSRNEEVKAFKIIENTYVEFIPETVVKTFPKLLAYEIWKCSVKFVGENHFQGLNELKLLNLARNKIRNVDNFAFKGLEKLEILDLSCNEIEFLPQNVFETVGKMEALYLSTNSISFLNKNIFRSMANLKKLSLSDNKIEFLNEKLFKYNKKLESIWLNNNKLNVISHTIFDGVSNMEYVNLANNVCIDDFHYSETFHDMKNDLQENCISASEKSNKELRQALILMSSSQKVLENVWRNKLEECEKKSTRHFTYNESVSMQRSLK